MKKIVIIGGGFCGTSCARELEKEFNVTLIDHKPYFEFTPSILRTIIEPDHLKKIQAMHKDYLKKAKIVNDEVLEISNSKVKTKDSSYDFDYLIITSGSTYNSPIKEEGLIPATRAKYLVECHNKLVKSKKVLIIGGGLVGVELAAEICTHYKNKEISLVHSHEKLMERNHPKSQKYTEDFLKKHNVKLIFNEKVKSKKGSSIATEKGKKIKADISFMCVGIKPNFEFMKKNFSSSLTDKNQLKINEFCQLENYKKIFAGGDITFVQEEKTAQAAEEYADVIIKNINNLEADRGLITYTPKKRPMVISLGAKNGIFEYKNIVITGFIPAMLKSFLEWKTMRKYR